MSFTYDPTTPQGQCRLMIADTDSLNPIFSDAEINAFFTIATPICFLPISAGQPSQFVGVTTSPRFAAATALEALASNASRLASALKVLDITIDTKTAAADLRATAKAMRDAENFGGAFAFVEWVPNEINARERIWAQLLRLQGGS